jgi:hypothetical protein
VRTTSRSCKACRQGQYRLRLARFRFRYDIAGRVVTLVACNLRREDTYA